MRTCACMLTCILLLCSIFLFVCTCSVVYVCVIFFFSVWTSASSYNLSPYCCSFLFLLLLFSFFFSLVSSWAFCFIFGFISKSKIPLKKKIFRRILTGFLFVFTMMQLCIQNNPNEARNMLLQNPQLAYALLQAQIVMKIVDPQVAMVRTWPIKKMIQRLQWDVCTCLDCNSLTGIKRGGLCAGSKERVRIHLCGTGQPTTTSMYSVSPISAQPCCCRLATACIWECLYSAQSQHVSQLLADGTDHPCFVCVLDSSNHKGVPVLWERSFWCTLPPVVGRVQHAHIETHTQVTHGCTPTSPPHTLVTDRW